MFGIMPLLLYPRWKSIWYPLNRRLGGPRTQSRHFRETNHSCTASSLFTADNTILTTVICEWQHPVEVALHKLLNNLPHDCDLHNLKQTFRLWRCHWVRLMGVAVCSLIHEVKCEVYGNLLTDWLHGASKSLLCSGQSLSWPWNALPFIDPVLSWVKSCLIFISFSLKIHVSYYSQVY